MQLQWIMLQMSDAEKMTQATQRLDTALKAMEDSVAGKRRKQLTVESLQEKLHSLEEILAGERTHGEKLASANEDVSLRIDKIMSSIRNMLQQD